MSTVEVQRPDDERVVKRDTKLALLVKDSNTYNEGLIKSGPDGTSQTVIWVSMPSDEEVDKWEEENQSIDTAIKLLIDVGQTEKFRKELLFNMLTNLFKHFHGHPVAQQGIEESFRHMRQENSFPDILQGYSDIFKELQRRRHSATRR